MQPQSTTSPLEEKGRHELKHRLNALDTQLLGSRLRAILPRDGHTNARGEYVVRSLYFDTPSDRALREKLDGVNDREKFRIRLYNGDASFLRLERKSKHNSLCYKQSTALTREQAQAIVRGDIQWMRGSEDSLLPLLYARMRSQALRPRTIIEYIREPFVYAPGNVRITLDKQIRTGLYATEFWRENLPLAPAGDAFAILEVKYDAFLPQFIADLVQLGDRRAGAFSKYAFGRTYG